MRTWAVDAKTRALVLAAYIEGQPIQRIADTYKISPRTVHRIARAGQAAYRQEGSGTPKSTVRHDTRG